MALTISAVNSLTSNFSLTESESTKNLSLSDSSTVSCNFSYGVSGNQVTNAASATGVITSGGSVQIDLYSLDQTTFNSTQPISFTGVKNFSVFNLDTEEGYDITISATGTDACTNLFNGGSGNLLVKPTSGFIYNDPFSGFVVSSGNRYVYLNDSGSGVTYSVLVFGLD